MFKGDLFFSLWLYHGFVAIFVLMNSFSLTKISFDGGGKPRVLVIDDSTIDLRLLLSKMAARNMRISIAFNGREGYEKACLQHPDLILLGVVMPKMDGFTICRLLQSQGKTRYIPVIFLSANSALDQRLQGLSLGAVDFIGKPFSEEEVIAKVEIHLNLVHRHQLKVPLADDQTVTTEIPQTAKLAYKDALLLGRATDYLQKHLRRPPSTEALATLFGTNEKRLSQVFQAGFALPVFGWIREERLRQARDLVAVSDISLLNIADHLGYCSAANFSTAFRARFGCSPSELRKQQQIKQLDDGAD